MIEKDLETPWFNVSVSGVIKDKSKSWLDLDRIRLQPAAHRQRDGHPALYPTRLEAEAAHPLLFLPSLGALKVSAHGVSYFSHC